MLLRGLPVALPGDLGLVRLERLVPTDRHASICILSDVRARVKRRPQWWEGGVADGLASAIGHALGGTRWSAHRSAARPNTC